MRTTLNATTIAWLTRCERRVWLDLHGDRRQRVADSSQVYSFLAKRILTRKNDHGCSHAVLTVLMRNSRLLPQKLYT
jgi:hypothetical protein